MNWKFVWWLVLAFALLAASGVLRKHANDRDSVELLRQKSALSPPESTRLMRNPPEERDIIALAETDSSAYCHPADHSADGCQLDAVLLGDEWTVFAWPYLGGPGKRYGRCSPDSARLFIYSRTGELLRQEHGGP